MTFQYSFQAARLLLGFAVMLGKPSLHLRIVLKPFELTFNQPYCRQLQRVKIAQTGKVNLV